MEPKIEWSRRSKKYKTKYYDSLKLLYGEEETSPISGVTSEKIISSSNELPIAKLPTEQQEQIKFVVWLRKQGFRVSASANGGSRHLYEAMNLKRMGVSKGFPDIEVPLPSGQYHGFYLEMKRQKGGKVSREQREWLEYLKDNGYYAEVANGFEEAKEMFLHYLSFTPIAA